MLHLVDESRMLNEMGTLRGQDTKRDQERSAPPIECSEFFPIGPPLTLANMFCSID